MMTFDRHREANVQVDSMTKLLDVALLQLCTPDRQDRSIEHAMPFLEEAAAGGANFIILPETCNLMQRDPILLARQLFYVDDDPFICAARTFAADRNVWLLVGSVLVRGESKARNRALLVAPDGSIAASYDKIHLFDVDLPNGERHRESDRYEAGDRAIVGRTPWGGVGLTICYDLRFPELHRDLSLAGAEMIATPAAFARPTGEAHWETLLRARAIENGCFVLAPAQGGTHADGSRTWGRSMIVDPWGQPIIALDHDRPGIVSARLDLSEVEKARNAIPSLAHRRRYNLG